MDVSTRVNGVLSPGACLASGEYRIDQPLGQGGFGITYQGLDIRLNRPVAVKEFFPEGCWREGATVVSAGRWNSDTYSNAKQKFLLEGQTLGQFNHPGIVRVFYYFEENNTAYMVMEYLRGKTLAEILKQRKGKLAEAEALAYIGQVGKALSVLHSSQFLHRDIKPDNIMLADDGRIVLIDFGAARDFTTNSTTRYTTMLTPGYAPLEQYGRALKYGAFTDIYALGSTLYHLLTGKAPVSAIERAAGVELKTVRQLNPRVSSWVSDAIDLAMIMDVNERLQSVAEFLDLLHLDSTELPTPDITDVAPGFCSSATDPWNVFGRGTTNSRPQSSNNSNKGWF
ncbi:serine/threonine protein kinase [Waterburya agarophytonicola K14]|uniref:Serine/threonine protein kinase n=1 Tax=Waterburya agarophytonicola KI4 TaxID=2874699 RepID=A0A964FIP5_9CYAN|nr:serine/threonine-protein kinase [Waterburya agarophytonicola]MCC0178619.1 serine/threonine protein kinase [Waterburya agarophytonicola KI4]